jgi:hypothetical protein
MPLKNQRGIENINARLAAHKAWAFAVLGKTGMARAIAFDALDLAKKIKPDQAKAWMKGLGDNGEDEGKVLRRQIEEFLESLGKGDTSTGRLKDAWSLFRRPFYLQGLVLLGMASSIAYAIQTASPPKPYVLDPRLFTPSQSYTPSNPYVPPHPAYAPPRSAYVRPATAPNGNPWPATAGYVASYPHTHTDGYSKVTIDNSQAAAGANRTKLAKEFGISRETLYQYIR